jgi:hypothetical protein
MQSIDTARNADHCMHEEQESRLKITCRARHDGGEAMFALDIVEDVEDAHAHAVLAAAVHVALHLCAQAGTPPSKEQQNISFFPAGARINKRLLDLRTCAYILHCAAKHAAACFRCLKTPPLI